jgi:flagellar basal body-associated protein FliL
MISDNQTDEFFNDRLRNYQSPVPAGMWDRIVEKKKRDRMLWLFFFRLLAVVILALGLTGGYFMFSQKKSPSTAVIENTKMNPIQPNVEKAKASESNIFSGHNKRVSNSIKPDDRINHQNTKTARRNKELARNYNVVLAPGKVNTTNKIDSSKGENRSESFFSSADSSKTENNKGQNKNDSLVLKHVVNTTNPDSQKDLKKPETKKNLSYRKWFLDLYGSADYPNVSPRENWQSELSFTAGIKINRSLGKHISVKTGIQFSQVNIVGGDSIFGGKIHLMRWDIPVLVGYSFGDGKLKTTFNGGVIMNLYSWPRRNAIPDFIKTNTGMSLYVGVNFEKRINERFSLFSEPYYRYQLTSMTISSISSFKFIDVAGINIGARYYFKK